MFGLSGYRCASSHPGKYWARRSRILKIHGPGLPHQVRIMARFLVEEQDLRRGVAEHGWLVRTADRRRPTSTPPCPSTGSHATSTEHLPVFGGHIKVTSSCAAARTANFSFAALHQPKSSKTPATAATMGQQNGDTSFEVPKTMKAVRYNKIKDWSLVEMPVPVPKPHEVLVKSTLLQFAAPPRVHTDDPICSQILRHLRHRSAHPQR